MNHLRDQRPASQRMSRQEIPRAPQLGASVGADDPTKGGENIAQRTIGDGSMAGKLTVSALGLGCMGMSDFYGEPDEAAGERAIRNALEEGVTLFDTADIYGPFTNERLVGRVLRDAPNEVKIATKGGIVRSAAGEMLGLNGSPTYLRQACEQSLTRLDVERIDLYYLHRVDPRVPVEESVGALADLVGEGKIAGIGLSEVSALTIARAHEVYPLTAVQTEYSLFSRDVERSILPAVRARGIGFVAYAPLGRGLLTGGIAKRVISHGQQSGVLPPRFRGGALTQNLTLAQRLGQVGASRGLTPGQVALGWLLAQGTDIIPIPGTRNVTHLLENIRASEVQWTLEELAWIEELVPASEVAGQRYENMTVVQQ